MVQGESKTDNIYVGMGDPDTNPPNPPTPFEPYVDWYVSSGSSKYYGSIVSVQDEYSWDVKLDMSPGQEVVFSWQDLESRVPEEYSLFLVVQGEEIDLGERNSYGPVSLERGVHDLRITATKSTPKIVSTKPASGINNNSATLKMSYDFGSYGSGGLRFEWRESGGSWSSTNWSSESGSGTYSLELSGLSPGTNYEFRAQARYSDGQVDNGSISSFTTSSPGNNPPNAAFVFSPSKPRTGEEVNFDASGSTDNDGEIVSNEWDFGDSSSASGVTVSHSYSSVGDYSIQLTVTDDDGAKDSITKSVNVVEKSANEKPTADADGPYSVDEGETISLDGSGTNDPDGSIESYSWAIVSGSGGLQGSGSVDPTFVAPENVGSDLMVEVKLNVMDDEGATDSDTVTITVSDVDGRDGLPLTKIALSIIAGVAAVTGLILYYFRSGESDTGSGSDGIPRE